MNNVYKIGSKVGYTYTPGFPAIRTQTARRFAEVKGFQLVCEVIAMASVPWYGSELYLSLINVINLPEIKLLVDDKCKESIFNGVMNKLAVIPDELLKKENTDMLGALVDILGRKSNIGEEAQFRFSFQIIVKCIGSSSLVIKLFGWEQLGDLLSEAKSDRPSPSSYIVEDAGLDMINGTYHICPRTNFNDPPQYTRVPSGLGQPMITLFRCTMRNTKNRWWFLSQADLEKPGTDKDIDYYLHRSTEDEEKEPPRNGWNCTHTGMVLRGLNPPPKLTPKGWSVDAGSSRESYMDMKVLHWCQENDLVEIAFNPSSIHREIVSRSCKLLLYLSEYEVLSADQIQKIWKAAIDSHDLDIVEEVFYVLSQLSAVISQSNFELVMNLATNELNQVDSFQKMCLFAEKFSLDDYKAILALHSPSLVQQFIAFVWNIYTHPHFEGCKSYVVITDLLSFCLKLKGGKELAFSKVLQAQHDLDSLAKSINASLYELKYRVDENAASKAIQTLSFLIPKFDTFDRNDIQPSNIPNSLITEIFRFVVTNRTTMSADEYLPQLAKRFEVLGKCYLLLACHELSRIKDLWVLVCDYAKEAEEFFEFLRGDQEHGKVDDIFSEQDILDLFNSVICSDRVNWSSMGTKAFECFKLYYQYLERIAYNFPKDVNMPPKLGLNTVWKMVLSSNQSSLLVRDAIDLLLQAYETMETKDSTAPTDSLHIIFEKLRCFQDHSGHLITEEIFLVERCMMILVLAIQKFENPAVLSHAARNSNGRSSLLVFYRRTTVHYNNSPMVHDIRYDKSPEGSVKVEVHPYHSVKILKRKIIDAAGLDSNIVINLDTYGKDVTDSTRLFELHGMLESTELSVSYQVNYSSQNYGDDPYGDNLTTSFVQLLVEDVGNFDSLLSLCQIKNSQEVIAHVWKLLMLLPTQPDLLNLVETTERDCYEQNESSHGKIWSNILEQSSLARTAYLLQIVDSLIQPPQELDALVMHSETFRESFQRSGGLNVVLSILRSTPMDYSVLSNTCISVCLHILHVLFSSTQDNLLDIDYSDDEIPSKPLYSVEMILQNLPEKDSEDLLERLLLFARYAATLGDSNIVQNALVVITIMIQSQSTALKLINNQHSKDFLRSVLRSDAKKVRENARNFAVQVGKAQPIVFAWLLEDLKLLASDDLNCTELFSVLSHLLLHSKTDQESDRIHLAAILSEKLLEYRSNPPIVKEERYALLGYLELLGALISIDVDTLKDTLIGKDLVEIIMGDFLFSMLEEEKINLCETPATRQASFRVLLAYAKYSQSGFEAILHKLTKLSKASSKQIHRFWGVQVSHEVRNSEVKFSGLKNQGCTCYMNSLLQVLFMSSKFRDSILATPIKECHRTTLWHKSGIDLVGKDVLFEWYNGSWRRGKIVGYDAEGMYNRVQYLKADGSLDESATFNIHEGRYQKETGRVKLCSSLEESTSLEPLSEQDLGAYAVLEQLQRTFCFLKYSKRRYFDPRPLVEACKTLNLNFNVYHQNDAAEFCDQLLDRIETATKGKHTKKDMWTGTFLKDVFGGKWLTQKIPKDCEMFSKEKSSCGHWQGSREESYLKVELMIRGKENIDESLRELVQGELMDGDNKIHCDVCVQKKAATRRTCFGSLPNMLLLHLKRFDLDFQTFETVKLNNRMEFPTKINMLNYTKEGLEALERAAAANQENSEDSSNAESRSKQKNLQYQDVSEFADINIEDYEYELQGILVHAGVAQGGHYYSFVKDSNSAAGGGWFKFDDDDVTPFNAEQIPVQCFGGSSSYTAGTYNPNLEDDRTSNALMLVYSKVKGKDQSVVTTPSKSDVANQSASDLIDGTAAFRREVQEANIQHTLNMIMVDPELHSFVRSLLSSISDKDDEYGLSQLSWSPLDAEDDLPLRTVQFGTSFLMDVVLHCRERPAMRTFLQVLKDSFETYPHTARWFLNQVLNPQVCSWSNDFLLSCTDPLARATFVQVLTNAATAVAPKGPTALDKYRSASLNEIREASQQHTEALCALLVRHVMDLVFRAVNHTKIADEIFVLLRDLCGIPSIANAFRTLGMVGFLSYYITPELSPQITQAFFEKHFIRDGKQHARLDFAHLHQSVFEAIAALLGVPQIRKVNLLVEKSYWESEFVPEAKEAFTQIFVESAKNGSMDAMEFMQYSERVMLSKPSNHYIRQIMDRFGSHVDNKLHLEGFLRLQEDAASYNPKQVWRVSCYYFYDAHLLIWLNFFLDCDYRTCMPLVIAMT